jgi:hypothetical protein
MIELAIAIGVVAGLIGLALILNAAAEVFWNWYNDAVWDEQEEDQPKPDDFPDSK